MGKEIKIGLAVIAALLVVLAVVVVKRITRPADETVAGGTEAAKHEEREEPSAKSVPIFAPAAKGKTAVGTTMPNAAKGEKKGSADRDWTFAADNREPPRVDQRGRPRPRRSRAPHRLTATPGPTTAGPGGRAAGWPNDLTPPGTTAGQRQTDPLADRSVPAGRDFAGTPGSDDRRRTTAEPGRTSEPRSLVNEPPRIDSPAGTSPLRTPAAGFGPSNNVLREGSGVADGDRNAGMVPRVDFAAKQADEPSRQAPPGGFASPRDRRPRPRLCEFAAGTFRSGEGLRVPAAGLRAGTSAWDSPRRSGCRRRGHHAVGGLVPLRARGSTSSSRERRSTTSRRPNWAAR